jgi:hypothetical protein
VTISITLAAALVAWLGLVLFFVMLGRMAAYGDGRPSRKRSAATIPVPQTLVKGALARGLVLWEEPRDVELELRDLRPGAPALRGPGARGRGARSVAGS